MQMMPQVPAPVKTSGSSGVVYRYMAITMVTTQMLPRVKEEYVGKARELFAGTGINITTEGKRHLGAAIGSRLYTEKYVSRKVTSWIDEIKQLAKIVETQPQAAYCAYTHGLSNCWTFVSRTVPNIANLLQPLEDAIQQHLIPALTGHPPCSREERDLLGLLAHLHGLGIVNPVSVSQYAFEASVRMTSIPIRIHNCNSKS